MLLDDICKGRKLTTIHHLGSGANTGWEEAQVGAVCCFGRMGVEAVELEHRNAERFADCIPPATKGRLNSFGLVEHILAHEVATIPVAAKPREVGARICTGSQELHQPTLIAGSSTRQVREHWLREGQRVDQHRNLRKQGWCSSNLAMNRQKSDTIID